MEIIEVAGVVALELVAGAGAVQRFERVSDILEAIAEDQIVRSFQHRRLPVMLEVLVALEHREQAEVHRAHVEAGDLGLPLGGRAHAFLYRHIRRAAGGEVDHHVGRLLDDPEKGLERFGRSEEHTSELQSLMRISYAVFCLKTKRQRKKTNTEQKK